MMKIIKCAIMCLPFIIASCSSTNNNEGNVSDGSTKEVVFSAEESLYPMTDLSSRSVSEEENTAVKKEDLKNGLTMTTSVVNESLATSRTDNTNAVVDGTKVLAVVYNTGDNTIHSIKSDLVVSSGKIKVSIPDDRKVAVIFYSYNSKTSVPTTTAALNSDVTKLTINESQDGTHDVMWAKSAEIDLQSNPSTTVTIDFKHLFTRIRFKTSTSNSLPVRYASITLKPTFAYSTAVVNLFLGNYVPSVNSHPADLTVETALRKDSTKNYYFNVADSLPSVSKFYYFITDPSKTETSDYTFNSFMIGKISPEIVKLNHKGTFTDTWYKGNSYTFTFNFNLSKDLSNGTTCLWDAKTPCNYYYNAVYKQTSDGLYVYDYKSLQDFAASYSETKFNPSGHITTTDTSTSFAVYLCKNCPTLDEICQLLNYSNHNPSGDLIYYDDGYFSRSDNTPYYVYINTKGDVTTTGMWLKNGFTNSVSSYSTHPDIAFFDKIPNVNDDKIRTGNNYKFLPLDTYWLSNAPNSAYYLYPWSLYLTANKIGYTMNPTKTQGVYKFNSYIGSGYLFQ